MKQLWEKKMRINQWICVDGLTVTPELVECSYAFVLEVPVFQEDFLAEMEHFSDTITCPLFWSHFLSGSPPSSKSTFFSPVQKQLT